jgi:hypothetical protein
MHGKRCALKRIILWFGVLVGICAIAFTPVSAAPRTRCFAETGYCVSDPILRYWESNGGLAVFGYPISPLRTETVEGAWVGPTQWFERDRLEDHGGEGVLAGRLGALLLQNQGRAWQAGSESPQAGCEFFEVTGYRLCEPFLSYWRNNGGLMRFGYPISGRIDETNEGWTGATQYFERRRMEWHTENAGTAYEVLLGRLGAATMNTSATVCVDWPQGWQRLNEIVAFGLPCASQIEQSTLTVQQFANGKAAYVPAIGEVVTVVTSPSLAYQRIVDTWQPSEIEVYRDGSIQIVRQIGKAWSQTWGMRDALGEPFANQSTVTVTLARFSNGAVAWQLAGQDTIYVVGIGTGEVAVLQTGP